MENQKQNKSVGTIVLVVLLLIVTVASLVLATYAWARYTTTGTGVASTTVAKWDVELGATNQTYQTSAFVKAEKLAPGMSGAITLPFTSANTEVAYDYVVSIQNLKNKPTNLKFYATRTGTGTDADPYVFKDEIVTFDEALSGSVALQSGKATDFGDLYYNGVKANGTTGSTTTATKTTVNPTSLSTPVIYWNWAFKTDTERNTVPTTEEDSSTSPVVSTGSGTYNGKSHQVAQYKSPAKTADMKKAMTNLANAVAVRSTPAGNTVATAATTYDTAQAALEAALGAATPATSTEVNDAIDTAEGMTAPTMTFNVVFTATQHEPSKNNPSNN